MLTISGHKGNATLHPWYNSYHQKHHQQQMLVRMWGKRNRHIMLMGMQASATTLENNMQASLKTKHRSAIWSSNATPRIIPKGMRLRLLHRHLHTHVYCSSSHNSQVLKTVKMTQMTNGFRKCGIYTQWNFTQLWKKMKSCHLQVNEWNWRRSPQAKLARLRRPKIICSPSYADFSTKKMQWYYWTW
jgi:hypothetical protein